MEAVVSSGDKILVLGGAGTGKTTTALWTARTYLETSTEIPAARVLFLTFSRSAVSQITGRSPGVLSGYKDRIEILTFHGLCYRLLQAFGRYAGYGTVPIRVQSDARTKLRGNDGSHLLYDDLISGATEILKRSDFIRECRHIHRHSRESRNPKAIGSKCVFASYRILTDSGFPLSPE